MITSQEPQVVHTLPKAFAVDVDATALKQIKVGFTVDIDLNSIEGSVAVFNQQNQLVQGKLSYVNRVLVFTFDEPVDKGHTYRVVISGDAESFIKGKPATKGIRSVIGIGMRKDYEFSFTTSGILVEIPKWISPAHYSVIDVQPVFRWGAVKDAELYELEVARSNQFRPLAIPESALQGIKLALTEFQWNQPLQDGSYYARVRAFVEGQWGPWSDVIQFHIDTVKEGPVAPGDDDVPPEPPVDEYPPDDDLSIEIVDIIPKQNASQVSPESPGIAVRLLGSVKLEDVKIRVSYTSIDEEDDDSAYQKVDGRLSTSPALDGTTWVIFTPNKKETTS